MNSEENKTKTKPKRLDYRTPKYREYRKALRKKERDYITLLKINTSLLSGSNKTLRYTKNVL